HDASIIANLNLDLQIVYTGNLTECPEGIEANLEAENLIISELDTAYQAEDPILFYFWTPHWIHAQYDLEQVTLPPYSEACYAAAEGVACDYPEDRLFKIFWVGLKDYAPEAYTFLRNFNYTNRDQIAMMAAVQLENKSVEEAARDWYD